MINRKQTAIIKKDLNALIANKNLFLLLILVPLVLTVVLPSIFILMLHFSPESAGDFQPLLDLLSVSSGSATLPVLLGRLILNNIMPIFFMLVPIMASTVMAASSFVGEKEKRTLETLLYSPLTLKEIFHAKIFASFLLSMIISFSSFIIMITVVETEFLMILGSTVLPDIGWLVTMFLASPALSLMSITLIVRSSAKAQNMEESQQRAVFLILPVILLVVGQFTGLFLINAWLLLALGLILALIAGLLLKSGLQTFNYEILLK